MKLNDYRQMMAYMRRPGFFNGTPPPKPEQKTPFIDKLKNLKKVAPALMPRSKVDILKMYMDEALKDGEITQEQHTEMLMPYFGELGEKVTEQIEVSDRENFDVGGIVNDPDLQAQIKDLFDQGFSNSQVAEKTGRGISTVKRVKKLIGAGGQKEALIKSQTEKYTKLKELVENANNGSTFVDMQTLRTQVGLPTKASPSDKVNIKKFNVPKLDTATDKIKKTFNSIIKNPNTPVEEVFDISSKIANATNLSQAETSKVLNNLSEYIDFIPVRDRLSKPASKAALSGKNKTLGDVIDIVSQASTGGTSLSGPNTPERFILNSVTRHINQGGDKVEWVKAPGVIDKSGNLITEADAVFKYKGKNYNYIDLLQNGRNIKDFKEVYKVYDELDDALSRPVVDPTTKSTTSFKNLMQKAYNKGANYSLQTNPLEVDHFDKVKNNPFSNLRVIPARINRAAGNIERQGAQADFFKPETKKEYSPDKIKNYIKKTGYNFTKDIDKLVQDEVNLANDIFLKNRKLRTPLEIAKEYEQQKLFSTKTPDAPKLSARIPGLSDLFEMAKDIPGDLKRAKYLSAGLKTLGVAATPLVAYDTYKAFKEGKPIAEALEQGFIGTDIIGSTKDLMALSPEGKEARSVVKQGEMREQITDDFSSLDTDFDTPNVKSDMSRQEAERKWENEKVAIGRKRAAEEKAMANARAISIEGLKNLITGERFAGQQIPEQFLAVGGRVGYADGPDDPSKRKFIKLGAGLMSLPIIGKYLKFAAPVAEKTAEIIRRGADGIPDFILDLIAKVKLKAEEKGMKYFTGNRSDEFADVYQADDFVVTEQGNKITLKKRKQEGDMLEKDIEMEIETDPETGGMTYKEATARPDAEGKLKDVEEFIDDIDLEDMKKYTYDE